MPNANEAQAQASQEPELDEKISISSSELSQIVNSAVTAQLKRAFAKELAPAIQSVVGPLKQQLDEIAKPKAEEAQQSQGRKSPEMLALESKLEQMSQALQKAEEEKAIERKTAREDRAFSELVTSLTGKVRPGSEQMVAKLLRADGKLVVDDENGATLSVRFSPHKGIPEQDHALPIADGVEQFLKTKDASIFLPSPSGGGAGSEGRVTQASRSQSGNSAPKFDKPPANSDEALARTLAQFEAMGISPDVLNKMG